VRHASCLRRISVTVWGMTTAVLDNVRVVLVEPTHPGNIGASARALKTMGLSRLRLVAPAGFPSAEATARASGADDVLYAAEVVSRYEDALRDCRLVIGASARVRSIAWPELVPAECAARLVEAAAVGPVALVFGPEHSGLSNAELDRCHYLVRIPAHPAYSSLNLAAAVQILAYEIRRAAERAQSDVQAAEAPEAKATAQEMEGLMAHLEETLTDIGFLKPAQPNRLMRRLWRLFNRARLERTEIDILRGILKSVQRRAVGGRGEAGSDHTGQPNEGP
jgi:tRNA (cytidine32/uridine32-2'-O)-methyltransferase